MNNFKTVHGFEEVLPLPARQRNPRNSPTLHSGYSGASQEMRDTFVRIINGAPEVMVSMTGHTQSPKALRRHLKYISRDSTLEMEDRDGAIISDRMAADELAEDWGALALTDSRRRSDSPLCRSMVLGMRAGVDAERVRDAARAFARAVFSEQFDYVFALHTDKDEPHVHLIVRALGDHGERLLQGPADLHARRQIFAQALRDLGIEAEGTPRWARGITRKTEPNGIRRIRERYDAKEGEPPKVWRAALRDAAEAAFRGDTKLRPWEVRSLEHQAKVRALFLAQALSLQQSPDPTERALGLRGEAFVKSMPPPDSRRLALARQLREANNALRHEHERSGEDRSR
jgi:hypothetical protein